MTINIDEARSIRLLVNQVVFPNFVVERSWFHDVNFAQSEMDNGSQASGSAGAIKGLPALLPSAGRKTATAIARDRPGQSAELWKP
jgi:hypothetical protein